MDNKKTKDSGIEWIGEIPKDWDILRLKNVLVERNETNADRQTDNILSLTNDRGVILYSEKGDVGNKSKEDISGYKIAYPNDLVLNSMNVIIGSVGISNYYGCVSPVYYMLRVRDKNASINFYNYIFQTKELQNKLRGYGNGILEIRLRIPMSKLNSIELAVPNTKIQHQIADFLDKKCSQIDELIANNQSQIDKLKEYKQSVITQAVTKGLDPNVETKDSGIDWIGQIPKNWEVNRIKYCSTYNDDVLKEDTNPNTIINYVDIGSVSLENGIEHIEKYLFYNAPSRARRRTQIGDIIISTVRTYLKAIASINQEELIVSTGFCVIRPNNKINKKYFEYFCKSDIFTTNVSKFSYGISYPAITSNILTSFAITEPNLNEQQLIADYLDKKCSQIDSLIEIKQQKIEKLQEYKKSLIYEYVTGKKEVC